MGLRYNLLRHRDCEIKFCCRGLKFSGLMLKKGVQNGVNDFLTQTFLMYT